MVNQGLTQTTFVAGHEQLGAISVNALEGIRNDALEAPVVDELDISNPIVIEHGPAFRASHRIIRCVSRISATEASQRFAEVLDAVEHRGETFTVVRRGRVVATIAPARSGTGADLRRILTERPPDEGWAEEQRRLRRFAGGAPVRDPSSG